MLDLRQKNFQKKIKNRVFFEADHNLLEFFKKYISIFYYLRDEYFYKSNQKQYIELFALLLVFILQTYALLVPFKGFPVFEIRKNLDLRKIC